MASPSNVKRLPAIVPIVATGAVLLGLAIILPSSCSVVPTGYRGVAVTFGKPSDELHPEGLAWKKPFIEKLKLVDVKQWTQTGHTMCFSSDLQTIDISYSVLGRVPADKVIELVRNYPDQYYDALVLPRVQECMKQIVAGYRAEELVKNRELVREKLIERVRQQVGPILEIVDVPITNIDLTDELEHAIEAKQVMEQAAQAKVYELQKEQKEAEITLVKANAEAEAIRIKGEAIANNPSVVDLEIIRKWDGRSPMTVVGQQGAGVMLPIYGADGKSASGGGAASGSPVRERPVTRPPGTTGVEPSFR